MALTPATTVTAAALAAVWKRPEAEAQAALDAAVGHLEGATLGAFRAIPQGVMDDMVRRVARAVFDQGRQQSAGSPNTTQMQGEVAVRAPRDPINVVAPILANYVVGLA